MIEDSGEEDIIVNCMSYTYKEPDLVKYIKINRLRWAGHVQRMEENRVVKRVFEMTIEGRRKQGRPKTILCMNFNV